MTRKSFFRVLFLISALASLGAPSSSLSQNPQTDGYRRETSVELIPRGPDGQRLPLARADIYLDVWGDGHLTPLPRSGQAATLRLDQEWLCGAWTDICKSRMEGPARLILQAEGYAPVTVIVYWPGQQRSINGPAATSAGIEFSEGRDVRIEDGAARTIDIAFRHSVPQFVRIVEESGAPAAGIPLEAQLYFAATNHAGAIEGESLARGTTDANGQVSIPDVDGEVAIELQRGRYVLKDPDRVSPFRRVTTLTSATSTTLVLHRFQKQPLNINFVSRNGSASDLILGTCLKYCSGACCGDEAITNSKGQIRVEDFYPEEIDSIYLTDKSGAVVWRGKVPGVGSSTAIPTITIPATPR